MSKIKRFCWVFVNTLPMHVETFIRLGENATKKEIGTRTKTIKTENFYIKWNIWTAFYIRRRKKNNFKLVCLCYVFPLSDTEIVHSSLWNTISITTTNWFRFAKVYFWLKRFIVLKTCFLVIWFCFRETMKFLGNVSIAPVHRKTEQQNSSHKKKSLLNQVVDIWTGHLPMKEKSIPKVSLVQGRLSSLRLKNKLDSKECTVQKVWSTRKMNVASICFIFILLKI